MRIALRPARSGDEEFARRLYAETMRETTERLFGWDDARERATFQRQYDPAEVRIIVADDRDVGWIQVQSGDVALNLRQFYVAPEFQRRGIGTIILKALIAEAESREQAITLSVVKGNPAQHLYEAHGFRVTHDDTYKHYMRRDLRTGSPES
jgi:ribosomal protein S18 acetylase RimI-like enzyme